MNIYDELVHLLKGDKDFIPKEGKAIDEMFNRLSRLATFHR